MCMKGEGLQLGFTTNPKKILNNLSGFLFFAFKWYHQESNRGHKDFQSFALPSELWHHPSCVLVMQRYDNFLN